MQRLLHRTTRGFTLLELMLVLAIIATIAAIAVPSLTGVFDRQKLRGATESIRLAWDEARLDAMRSGQAQVFTCELETGNYLIQPLVLQSDMQNVGAGATVITGAGLMETEEVNNGMGNSIGLGAVDGGGQDAEQLEDGMTFLVCRAVGDMRSFATAQESSMSGTGAVTEQNVSESVIFYPDGSTSTAEVRLKNERGDIRAVQLRGLTGHTRTVEISFAAAGQSSADATGGL